MAADGRRPVPAGSGIFVGRPYCRWLCPYGALLSVFSRYAWRSFSITPDRELDCGLCSEACPYGAIEQRRAVAHVMLRLRPVLPLACPGHHTVAEGDGRPARKRLISMRS